MLDGSDPKDSVYEWVLVREILVVNTNYRPLFSVWDPWLTNLMVWASLEMPPGILSSVFLSLRSAARCLGLLFMWLPSQVSKDTCVASRGLRSSTFLKSGLLSDCHIGTAWGPGGLSASPRLSGAWRGLFFLGDFGGADLEYESQLMRPIKSLERPRFSSIQKVYGCARSN